MCWCRRVALLVAGDAAALLLFAAIGRANHGESLDPASILSVAWPFLAGLYSPCIVKIPPPLHACRAYISYQRGVRMLRISLPTISNMVASQPLNRFSCLPDK